MGHHHAPPGLGRPEFFAHAHSAPGPSGPPEATRLHLHGTVLPEGEVRDLWIVDGLIRTEPVADAVTVSDGGWILPGLVDAHCHVGLAAAGGVDRPTAAAQARADRDAGTLLIRDAGSPVDTRWMDAEPDLPRIIRAGRHIARTARYIRNYAVEVEPAALVAEVEVQARRGDGWVKLVGDWIDRDRGDLGPLWPREVQDASRWPIPSLDREAGGARDLPGKPGVRLPRHGPAAGLGGRRHLPGLRERDPGRLRPAGAPAGSPMPP